MWLIQRNAAGNEELNAFISVLGVIRADIDQHLVSRK